MVGVVGVAGVVGVVWVVRPRPGLSDLNPADPSDLNPADPSASQTKLLYPPPQSERRDKVAAYLISVGIGVGFRGGGSG